MRLRIRVLSPTLLVTAAISLIGCTSPRISDAAPDQSCPVAVDLPEPTKPTTSTRAGNARSYFGRVHERGNEAALGFICICDPRLRAVSASESSIRSYEIEEARAGKVRIERHEIRPSRIALWESSADMYGEWNGLPVHMLWRTYFSQECASGVLAVRPQGSTAHQAMIDRYYASVRSAAARSSGANVAGASPVPAPGDNSRYSQPEICQRALDPARAGWDTSPLYASYVAEAQRRGYSVASCQQALGVGNREQVAGASTTSDAGLCSAALRTDFSGWDTRPGFAGYVNEAQRRGLTLERCRAMMGRSTVASVSPPAPAQSDQQVPALPIRSSGSGFFVSLSGHVLTNNHVVATCSAVAVSYTGWRRAAAIVRQDPRSDLALIRVDMRSPQVASFRDGSSARPGEPAIAVGFPLQGLLSSEANVAVGAVSASRGIRGDERYLQMTTAVQGGNSGGPLLDASGNVIGIVTARADERAFLRLAGQLPQNINFAIHGELARRFVESAGVAVSTARSLRDLKAADVGDIGRAVTTRVECLGTQRPKR
jgi:S1-C subfamily serine protease